MKTEWGTEGRGTLGLSGVRRKRNVRAEWG